LIVSLISYEPNASIQNRVCQLAKVLSCIKQWLPFALAHLHTCT